MQGAGGIGGVHPNIRPSRARFATVALAAVLMLILAACVSTSPWPSSEGGGVRDGTVTVRKGDTLYSIARRHEVSLRELISRNGIRPPYTIYVGQRLKLPQPHVHVVQKGETIYRISRNYGLD